MNWDMGEFSKMDIKYLRIIYSSKFVVVVFILRFMVDEAINADGEGEDEDDKGEGK